MSKLLDLVYVSIEKDKDTLEIAIEYARNNITNLNAIFVVSENKLTAKAQWIQESIFPFTKEEVKQHLSITNKREGWYFQQLLKYYAPLVVEGIEEDVLICCSDSVFLNKIEFINNKGQYLFNAFRNTRVHKPYLDHIRQLFPEIATFQQLCGTCHHMVFNKTILLELMKQVETATKQPFWKSYLNAINKKDIPYSGSSDYESYYNYMFHHHSNLSIQRHLSWFDDGLTLNKRYIDFHKKMGFQGMSFHAYKSHKSKGYFWYPPNWLRIIKSYLRSEKH